MSPQGAATRGRGAEANGKKITSALRRSERDDRKRDKSEEAKCTQKGWGFLLYGWCVCLKMEKMYAKGSKHIIVTSKEENGATEETKYDKNVLDR